MHPGNDDETILGTVIAHATNFKDHVRWLYEDIKRRNARRIVELGVFYGQSTFAFLCAARAIGGHLDSADVVSYPETRAFAALTGLDQFWTYHVCRSLEYAAERGEPIDVLLIDSSHEYAETLAELRAFAPLMAPDGVIYIHDILADVRVGDGNLCSDNIRRAIEEFLTTPEGADWRITAVRKESCGLAVLEWVDTPAEPATRKQEEEKVMAKPKFSVVYYSHNQGPKAVLDYCLHQLAESVHAAGGELIAVTWKPVPVRAAYRKRGAVALPEGADKNIIVEKPIFGHEGIYRQILAGLDAATAPLVFLAEHDVLYPASYFSEGCERANEARVIMPIYYNDNVQHLTAHGYFPADTFTFRFLSNACGQTLAIRAGIEEKLKELAETGKVIHAEPRENVLRWRSSEPVIDIRHGANLTGNREAPDGEYAETLAPWGDFRRYAFMFPGGVVERVEPEAPKSLPAIPGMAIHKDPQIRLADCCDAASITPGPHGYQYAQIDGEWFSIVWIPLAKRGTEQDWAVRTDAAPFCQACGHALDEHTPRRGYHRGPGARGAPRWQPLDAGIDSRIAEMRKRKLPV